MTHLGHDNSVIGEQQYDIKILLYNVTIILYNNGYYAHGK